MRVESHGGMLLTGKTTLCLLLSRVYTDESRRLVFQTGLLPSSLRVRGPPSGRRAVRHGAVRQEIFQTIAGPATGNVAEFQGAQKRVPLWKRGIPQYEVNTARRTGVSSELYQEQEHLLASPNTTGTVLGTVFGTGGWRKLCNNKLHDLYF
jgi:hypothetical protein